MTKYKVIIIDAIFNAKILNSYMMEMDSNTYPMNANTNIDQILDNIIRYKNLNLYMLEIDSNIDQISNGYEYGLDI